MKEWTKVSEELIFSRHGTLDDLMNILTFNGYGIEIKPITEDKVSVVILEENEVNITIKAIPCHDCKRSSDCL